MAPTKEEPPADSRPSKKPKLITEFFAASKKSASTVKDTKASPLVTEQKINTLEKNVLTETKTTVSVESTDSQKHFADESPQGKKGTLSDAEFCKKMNFDKAEYIASLSDEEKSLLSLEINTLHITWLACLHKEIRKPYFLKLKLFLRSQAGKTVFPPPGKIYMWSHLTPLPEVKCLILGQDPYHNVNQAHGLAFLVLEPTRPPPSLVNIYKALKIDFPDFEIPDYAKLSKAGCPGGGNLTRWAKRGVLMLNACLTVEAHKANSHANQGWETFTELVIKVALEYAKEENRSGFVIMAWGTPAQKRVAAFSRILLDSSAPFLVLRTVHPSPLSASRGFFDLHVFKKCNEWLLSQKKDPIDWGIMDGNSVTG
ncbi:uracil-DNA glycosylase [Metschnikowia bicuspidata]|uniref:Uracil-DNA glycosylase n=1 Tax=Metschnikowia bicuspidata TaxID=27322 RepID=A0A4P9ZIY3_9ASCO|nr:uracil-DNA glycosylase [Metschnikowia bicuspidata]